MDVENNYGIAITKDNVEFLAYLASYRVTYQMGNSTVRTSNQRPAFRRVLRAQDGRSTLKHPNECIGGQAYSLLIGG